MKNKGIKLLICATAILFLTLWKVSVNKSYPDDHILDVAFPSKKNIESYDPAQIHFSYEYVLLENIYSPLIELSNTNSEPFAAVARMFYWEGNELHFVIRDDLKTIDGYLITVDDVVASLKRLLILSKNTHGDFKNLVCSDVELKSMEDDCPGIDKKNNTLILRPKYRRSFIIDIFASIDFAIIPKNSFDPVSLKITNYRNTSGPYYVDRDNKTGRIILKPNPAHFHFEKRMPQEVHLIPTKGMERDKVISLLNQGEVDHITTIHGLEVQDLKKIDLNKNNLHETIHIQTAVAYITDKGKKRVPLKKRLSFAKALQKGFHDHFCIKEEGCRPTKQFFLPLIGGFFPNDDDATLQKVMDSVKIDASGVGIELGIYDSNPTELKEYIRAAKSYMPNLNAEKAKGIPAFAKLKDSDIPDYIIVFTDSGFLDSISLLSYTINTGIFGFPKKEGKAWLKDYMNTEGKLNRMKKLRAMHLQSLTQAWMIPLYRTPYVAIARHPWKMHLPELFANNPFWKIRKE